MTENGNDNHQEKNQGGNEGMKEDVNTNGNGNDEKTKPERDTKGRFIKGCSGGPGRGKKADEIDLTNLTEDEFWAAMEVLNRQDMMSKDPMTRQRAMKLKVMKDEYLFKKRDESKAQNLITEDMQEFMRWRAKQGMRKFDLPDNTEGQG